LWFGNYIFSIDVVYDWCCRHELHWISSSGESTRCKVVALLTPPSPKVSATAATLQHPLIADVSSPGAVAVLRMWRQILVGLELGG
jgi:hypothetical protein